MKLDQAYMGNGEYRFFIGPERVGSCELIEGRYYPQVRVNESIHLGRALTSLEAVQAWILMMLRRTK
jgi:hypothetical protein